jgi:hypothetical protein
MGVGTSVRCCVSIADDGSCGFAESHESRKGHDRCGFRRRPARPPSVARRRDDRGG